MRRPPAALGVLGDTEESLWDEIGLALLEREPPPVVSFA